MTMNGFSVVPWNLSCAITISGIHHNCDSITSIFGNNCLILRIRIFDGCLFVKPMKVCVCSDKKKNTRSTTYVATILSTCTVNNAARQNFGLYMFEWLQVHCLTGCECCVFPVVCGGVFVSGETVRVDGAHSLYATSSSWHIAGKYFYATNTKCVQV